MLRFENVEKILEDENNPLLKYGFEYGYSFVNDMIEYDLEWDGENNQTVPAAEIILPLISQAVGMLNYLEYFAKYVHENPKMTFAQMEVLVAFEDDMRSGLNMAWGVEADKVLPPKGDGWQQYVAAKQAVGL